MQEIILDLLADMKSHSVQEMKNYLEQSGATEYSEGQFAGSINTLLRNKTIIKIDRAIYRLAKESRGADNMKYCFVVSPVGEEKSEIRANADKLLKHIINPVCQSCGFSVERVDQINDSDSITQTIIDKLLSADLVIADISGHNPNVFYEMGYRKCTGKPIIHLKSKGENLPFDVNTIRTFEYDLTDLDSVDAIKERLQQTISAISFETVDELEENANSKNDNTFSGLLPILYQIQDSISDLKTEISRKDNETLQTIMQTSLNNAAKAESADEIMMKVLLPELLRNPESFSNLMQIAEIANSNTKK
ncbi:MAG TPA: nucleoside 2-deoxyribosyltransferase [Erysipelotrichaceae bacterium]|nr:nucleoside 2-deoxyribosyltransferase [Erysipelotrichaceae bacterium]